MQWKFLNLLLIFNPFHQRDFIARTLFPCLKKEIKGWGPKSCQKAASLMNSKAEEASSWSWYLSFFVNSILWRIEVLSWGVELFPKHQNKYFREFTHFKHSITTNKWYILVYFVVCRITSSNIYSFFLFILQTQFIIWIYL